MPGVVALEVTDRVALITIRRPEARNAVNAAVAAGIDDALERIEADGDIWVGVLTGEGSVFSAGADLRAIADGERLGMVTERGGFGGLTKRDRRKPLIAAVDGPALAGGLELALACDLIVASRNAVFGLPEVKRSLIAAGGGLFRLPRALGQKVAMEMILTGDPISAERAYQLGLVNRVVEPGEVVSAALALAARIALNAPFAVWESRQVAANAWTGDDHHAWQATAEAASKIARSEDFAEGPRAFVEKRPPRWEGR
ncbi:MAG: crotonase/enoyl-CoA hydratase family protein [Actinomycetota bacterium]|nr:crotonase/enoyl-CoA hydratase family protein [Actinomycetota bacterium]